MEINLAIFYKAACITDVLTTWKIILFRVTECSILGSKDATVEGESLFTELIWYMQSTVLERFLPEKQSQPLK